MPKTTAPAATSGTTPTSSRSCSSSFHRTPAGIAWRWRTELATLAILTAVAVAAGHPRSPSPGRPSSWPGSLAVVLAVPHSRRFITRRFWCVLARHRLQRLCYEARLHTRSGRLPLILWTRPTQVGERTWVLCRAGICAEDFDAHIGELRAACYARDARVTRNRRWSHLVTIDIIRRDTLAASNTITSPLARLTAHYQHQPARPGPSSPTLPKTSTTRPHNPARRSPGHSPGAASPRDRLGRRHRNDHH